MVAIKLKSYYQSNLLHSGLVFLLLLITYVWSMPRTVVLGDDGLFLLAAYFNGVAHPPGYPLYTVIAHLATYLPFGSIAARVHALSGIFAAFAGVWIWWIVKSLIPGRIFAYIAALSFGFSAVVWSQAIIAEVYSLNLFLFFLVTLLCMRYINTNAPDQTTLLKAIALIYGFGLANHWPLMVLSTPMILGVLWPRWKEVLHHLPSMLPYLFLGLLPYVWLVIRSLVQPEINFSGALDTWDKFWAFVSREVYSGVDYKPSADWFDKLQFAGFVLRETTSQYSLIAFIFVLVGFLIQWCYWPLHIGIALTLGFAGSTFVLIGLLGFEYDFFHQTAFQVYPHIAYGIVAIWLSLGVYTSVNQLIRHQFANKVLITVGLAMLVIATTFLQNLPLNYRAADIWAAERAKVTLSNLEPNAIYFTYGDGNTGPLGYMNMVEKIRPDVTVYNALGLIFENRLFDPINVVDQAGKNIIINQFVEATSRPIYYTGGIEHQYANIHYGLFLQVDKLTHEQVTTYQYNEQIMNYFYRLLAAGEPKWAVQRFIYRRLVADYCRMSVMFAYAVGPEFAQEQIPDRYCRNYLGYMEVIEILLEQESPDLPRIQAFLLEAEPLRDQSITQEDYAQFDYFQGLLAGYANDQKAAVWHFIRATELWENSDNPAWEKLAEIKAKRANLSKSAPAQ